MATRMRTHRRIIPGTHTPPLMRTRPTATARLAGVAAGATGDEDSAAGRCSLCTAHCAGVSFVPVAARTLALAAPGSDRIDFLGRQPAGYVPDILDRPPQLRTGS